MTKLSSTPSPSPPSLRRPLVPEALLAKYDTTKSETLNEAALIAMIKGNTLTTASFKALPAEDHTAHTGAAHSEEDELAEALLKKYGAADKMTEAQIIAMIKANALTTASFKALPQDAHAGHDHSAHSAEDELAEALLGRYDADKTTALSEAEIINMIKGNALTSKTFPALPVDAHAGHGHRVLAEDAHSEEEELAEALLLKYDAAPKTGTLSEAELIVMIKGNKLTTKSFPALGAAETPTTPTAKSQWTDNAGLAFIGTLITCAASLAGAIIVLPLSKSCTKKYGRSGCNAIYGHLAALTTGVLLAAVFVHILPEANTMAGNKPHDWVIGSCFLGGVFTCFIVRFCVNACAESAGTEPKNTESAKNTESEKKGAAPGTAVVPLDSGATAETAVGEDIKSTDLEAATIAEDPDQCTCMVPGAEHSGPLSAFARFAGFSTLHANNPISGISLT